ncbi:MAG: cell envelope integrity protein TolA [Beijerinckiaceae bacterium]
MKLIMALSDRLREPGLPLSAGLHVLALAGSLLAFNQPTPLPDAIEAIAVEVVDESQIREVTKGEANAKTPAPVPRVDRVAEKPEQNAPGQAPRQINSDQTPKPQEATAKEERKEETATIAPPPPLPRTQPPRPPEPPRPEPPKPVAVKPPPKSQPAPEEEDEDEADEIIKQAAKKREEEQKRAEQAALARKLEQQKADDQKKLAEDARRREDTKRADEARRQEQLQQEAERRREIERKLTEAKAAEDKKKVEDQKKAQEAAKKAADEQRKRESEQQQARNQQALENARRALLASREAPTSSGNTGQQVSRTPAAGAATATGQKLNPSDRAALVGIIRDQIEAKMYQAGGSAPSALPRVRIQLAADGAVQSVSLTNASADPAFRALADAGMRAIRQASPFRIPTRYSPMFSDWRDVVVQINPPE